MLPVRAHLFLVMTLALQLIPMIMRGEGTPSGCQWDDSSGDWMLARRTPVGDISGPLGHVAVPFLHKNGIPVSFISEPLGDTNVQLHIDSETTTRQLLEEIIRQEPRYRFAIIKGRVVIYPAGEEYDRQIEVGHLRDVTRSRAMYSLLAELKDKDSNFQKLQMPVVRGGGGKTLYGDKIDIGGAGTSVEHLLSLTGVRPSVAVRVLASSDGRLSFSLDWIRLIEKIEVQAPSRVEVDSIVDVKIFGTLVDGTVVPLGWQCGVEYEVADGGSIEIDASGRVLARRAGVSTLRVRYENNFAQLTILVVEISGSDPPSLGEPVGGDLF